MIHSPITSTLQKVRRFATDRNGVVATEFALILPLMLTFYFGAVEVTQAVAANRKTTMVAHTVADLVSQVAQVGDLADIFSAATAVAAPYSPANLTVTVSSVIIDNAGVAKVKWTETHNGAAQHAAGDIITLDPALAVPNTSLVIGEVNYAYKSMFGWVLKKEIYNLGDKTYMRPRVSACVTRPPDYPTC